MHLAAVSGRGTRLRGQSSVRRKPVELRAQVPALYAEERCEDFGPTLRAKQLAKVKLLVVSETAKYCGTNVDNAYFFNKN